MKVTKEHSELNVFMQDLTEKCWKDQQFFDDLIASPLETLKKTTGNVFDLGDHFTDVKVEDQTDPDTIYLNISAKPDFDNLVLTDEQLEMVAGGILMISAATLGWIVAGVIVGGVTTGVVVAAIID